MRQSIVAIPVKDEAERLPACLNALAAQRDKNGRPLAFGAFGAAIFANNCSDESAELVRTFARGLPFAVRLVEASLLPDIAHAGGARRVVMDLAEAWLSEKTDGDGVILTTDTDSQVAPDWIANNLAAIDGGADAVLGRVVLDEEGELLPQALHSRGGLESMYETLLTELSALLDPIDCNPWPHHATISGATLAVTSEAYRRVGGLPCVPLGEDKALIAELLRVDARIRFCPNIEVTTSGRIDGRAPGGVADTLRLRSADPDAFCDGALEPFGVALGRAKWRGRLRRLYRSGRLNAYPGWTAGLGINHTDLRAVFRAKAFGELWRAIEATSPVLTRRLLKPAQLPGQISIAQRVLPRVRKCALPSDQDVNAESVIAVATLDSHRSLEARDEDLGSLVAG
jgi:GT2 family glycosyltransferase